VSEPTPHDLNVPVDEDVDETGGSTGEPSVDAAVARLAELDERPTGEHAEVYEEVHRRLDGLLRGVAAEPGPSPG
jgi:hypothetical protein